ncbi:hypothetical protein LZ578_03115 [Jeotgalibaca sp. MA1X17-3]|uniref:hypothetical protein n=1 Tax=Jeotgalibaca sp. MA1X17-3 TaxID=2908211 RepID=UPI001F461CC2|nr:hypothetical protein [Jeotgalibaca sp. MA1X17-3]UJF16140.1 hypothetical protein LZ578_03115 [Jeotgalibaca sp. MA1X17-3]
MINKTMWDFVKSKVDMNIREIGKNFPKNTANGTYLLEDSEQRIAGYWPGVLWQAYQAIDDESYAMLARELEVELENSLFDPDKLDQNDGIMWTLTSLADYKVTGDKDARKRALQAANLQMARFNVAGNFIGSKFEEGENQLVTIDSVMDASLLFWAASETEDIRYKHVAEAHLTTIIQYFIREDGSLCQSCLFNSETGEFIEERASSEEEKQSSVAMSLAWAIYGFSLAARYARRPEYIDAAKLFVDDFLENFQTYIKVNPSAAAITANGLLIFAKLTSVKSYREDAEKIITDLFEHHSTKENVAHQGMILSNNKNDSESDMEGDYFFTEAVVSFVFDKDLFW